MPMRAGKCPWLGWCPDTKDYNVCENMKFVHRIISMYMCPYMASFTVQYNHRPETVFYNDKVMMRNDKFVGYFQQPYLL